MMGVYAYVYTQVLEDIESGMHMQVYFCRCTCAHVCMYAYTRVIYLYVQAGRKRHHSSLRQKGCGAGRHVPVRVECFLDVALLKVEVSNLCP